MKRGHRLNRRALIEDFIASGMRQQDVANKSGLSKTLVSRLLNGEGRWELFDLRTLGAIAKVFQPRKKDAWKRYVMLP